MRVVRSSLRAGTGLPGRRFRHPTERRRNRISTFRPNGTAWKACPCSFMECGSPGGDRRGESRPFPPPPGGGRTKRVTSLFKLVLVIFISAASLGSGCDTAVGGLEDALARGGVHDGRTDGVDRKRKDVTAVWSDRCPASIREACGAKAEETKRKGHECGRNRARSSRATFYGPSRSPGV